MRLLLLIAGALLLIPAGARAGDSVKLTPVASGAGLLYADGERFAVWHQGNAWTLMDDRGAGRQLALTCDPNSAVLGSGYFLVNGCAGSSPRPQVSLQVHDLRTGAIHDGAPPSDRNPDTFGGDFDATFYGVGARWAEVSTGGNHWQRRVFYDWRTGQTVDDDAPATVFPDLAAGALYRPLCAPLVRVPGVQSSYDLRPEFLDTQFNGSLMLVRSDSRLRLWRCGHARPAVVSNCEPVGCDTAQLSHRYLTWAEGRSINVRVLRSRKTHRMRAPTTNFSVAHTGRRLFVLGDGTLYVGRLPRR